MGRHRKAIAASSGVLLIALLEYAATTPDVERALELVVPHGIVPLMPVLFGGLATVAAVWKASNARPSPPTDSVEAPAPAIVTTATADSVAPAPGPAPTALSPQDVVLTSTVGAGAPILDLPAVPAPPARAEPSAETSLVQLLPAPASDYR